MIFVIKDSIINQETPRFTVLEEWDLKIPNWPCPECGSKYWSFVRRLQSNDVIDFPFFCISCCRLDAHRAKKEAVNKLLKDFNKSYKDIPLYEEYPSKNKHFFPW
jgi:hypothetical protein